MTTVNATFDGSVFVPESPVDLPVGFTLQIPLPSTASKPEERSGRPLMDLLKVLESLPENPDWPPDGAAQIDHYLYGTPKKP